MPRKPGSLARFTCTRCHAVCLVPGGNVRFICQTCRPRTAQDAAHKAVADAIRRGELERPSNFNCADCGGSATEYDHRDYSRPLQVDPVCRGCNARRGPAIGHVTKRSDRRVEGADPTVDFSRLNSHGLKHGQPSPATPLN